MEKNISGPQSATVDVIISKHLTLHDRSTHKEARDTVQLARASDGHIPGGSGLETPLAEESQPRLNTAHVAKRYTVDVMGTQSFKDRAG